MQSASIIGLEVLQNDLNALLFDVQHISTYLLSPPSPALEDHKLPCTPTTPSRFIKFTQTFKLSRQVSLGRKTSNGRSQGRGRGLGLGKGKYDKLDKSEQKAGDVPLLKGWRGSEDSDQTLVELDPAYGCDGSHHSITQYDEIDFAKGNQEGQAQGVGRGRTMEVEKLLAVLAPHIAELQRLGSRISSSRKFKIQELPSMNAGDTIGGLQLSSLFEDVCSHLLDLLFHLKRNGQPSLSDPSHSCSSLDHNARSGVMAVEKERDSHVQSQNTDLEMRDLMISALIKKVEFELQRNRASRSQSSPPPNKNLNVNHPKNPFVVHSTSVRPPLQEQVPIQLSSGRRGSAAKPIFNLSVTPGVCATAEHTLSPDDNHNQSIARHNGFSEYAFPAQSTSHSYATAGSGWAKNLVRLGSYQASLLFSNSPVAVRKVGEGARA